MIVAVDFDNTLINTIDYPCLKYTLLDHAKETILNLSQKGVEFRVNTARTGWFRLPVIYFIWRQKLPMKTYLFNQKVRADIYIDDSNIFCRKINWYDIEKELLTLINNKDWRTKCTIFKKGLK